MKPAYRPCWVKFNALLLLVLLLAPNLAMAQACGVVAPAPAVPVGSAPPAVPATGVAPPAFPACPSGLGVAYTDDSSGVGTLPVFVSGMSIGSADSDRVVVAAVTMRLQDDVTGVTIGGVAATEAVQNTSGVYYNASIWYAPVPLGATADVTITTASSTGYGGYAVALYSLTGSSSTSFHDSDEIGANGVPVDAISTTLNIPANGAAVYTALYDHNTTDGVWSSATPDMHLLTQSARAHASSHLTTTGALSGHEEGISFSSDVTVYGVIGASFAP